MSGLFGRFESNATIDRQLQSDYLSVNLVGMDAASKRAMKTINSGRQQLVLLNIAMEIRFLSQ